MQNGKPAPSRNRERFPSVRESIGEDPARFLDRELVTPGASKVDVQRSRDGSVSDSRIVIDRKVSSGITFVQARIDGIDDIDVAREWIEVEKQLDRGPRKQVIARLNKRIQELQERGERPDRLAHGPRERCDCCDPDDGQSAEDVRENRRESRQKLGGMTTGSFSPSGSDNSSQASTLDAFATDGGSDE